MIIMLKLVWSWMLNMLCVNENWEIIIIITDAIIIFLDVYLISDAITFKLLILIERYLTMDELNPKDDRMENRTIIVI